MQTVPDAWVSVSATTRKPREGEVNGQHYFFLSREAFDDLVAHDGFLEWATYSGNSYGTLRSAVEQHMASGDQVILEIEVQGAMQVKSKIPSAHLVFIEPPSLEVLEQRLRGRGTESEEDVQKRLSTALIELSRKNEYDYVLVNDELDRATKELTDYVNACAES